MKTVNQLLEFVNGSRKIDAHVHTHLCDGKPEMTVENIANEALAKGFDSIILTPHFHKKVTDSTASLYENSDESIFLSLRDEIDAYAKDGGKVRFLLSCEADILSLDGETSLDISKLPEGSRTYAPSITSKYTQSILPSLL